MASGRPDYNQVSVIKGLYDTTPTVLAVDASGRIIMVPYGIIHVDGEVDVNQLDSNRIAWGSDGATARILAVDANGQLIMVPRGQSGNYMAVDASGFLTSIMKGKYSDSLVTLAVDASGNIIGILKGDFAGALKTLAVDAQGRMLAVLTDPEDVFGNPHYMGAAELAARLGSGVNFDRYGELVFLDDFESGLDKWVTNAMSANATVTLSTLHAKTGAFAAKFYTPATLGSQAKMYHYQAAQTLGKVGLEVSFNCAPDDVYVNFALYAYVDPWQQVYEIRFDRAEGVLQYKGDDLAYHTFASGVQFMHSAYLFNTIKFVVDLSTQKYVSCRANDTSYDLSDYDCGLVGYEGLNWLNVLIILENQAATSNEIWVDDVILTQNEP